MAFSVKPSHVAETGGELHANKIVIVTGPNFGTGVKLILFGAALGAAGALYWKNQQEMKVLPTFEDTSPASKKVRLKELAERAKELTSRASDALHSAAEIAAPALQSALQEAKQAAREAESEINDELRELEENRDKPEQV